MDTPLYVLSTAASMVESVDVSKHTNYSRIEEAALKRTLDSRDLTNRVAPMTPPQYQDLHQEGARGSDDSSQDDSSKKCAGTQTSFSSFSSATYDGPSEKYMKTDSGMSWNGPKPSPSPPSYYAHHHAPPPRYNYSPETAMETDEMPLNLTKSSSTHQDNIHNSPASSRLSPSSRYSPPVVGSDSSNSFPHQNGGSTHNKCNTRKESVLDDCEDPEIEEHFRRSLGSKYTTYMTSRSSPKNGEIAEPGKTANISITGNVDDHFAKSLGATWTKLNAPKQSPLSGTVDDHFAKALGDTWYKIKARTEGESHSRSSPLPL